MKFAIFTIIKNEHDYLDEWIQYHLSIGIDKIFIFDDVFSNPHKSICEKYKKFVVNENILALFDKKEVENIKKQKVLNTEKNGLQMLFMKKALNHLQKTNEFYWCGYIDVDEFLTFESDQYTFKNIFCKFVDYEIVALQWKNFNASGHIHKPDGLVLNTYTTTCQLYTGKMSPKASSKLFFNLMKWNEQKIITNHHIPKKAIWCKTDYSTDPEIPVYKKIYIRHYITKSFEEYCYKIFIRGQFQNSKKIIDFFAFNKNISKTNKEVMDILRYYQSLKIK